MYGTFIFAAAVLFGDKPLGDVPDLQAISICDLANDAAKWDGHRVRIAAMYTTDLRHGALFLDKRCPLVSIQEGPSMSDPVDRSVVVFNASLTEPPLSQKPINYKVDVAGVFRVANDKLIAEHSLMHGVIGEIVVEKVVEFSKVASPK
ncbi:hypothetical protein [Dyella sp. 20L07]|uniref:hypothetical protein n=1 Tax=Dyella sp. 20L07 TaxID=3384240 RepID=UPI003D2AB576